ncbi:imidazoleglycerol-phosphate dehydratase HisB [Rubricoccus marinus]|uniref:Imidazoleglycerol-phosphate dehydratase n=1 Tax=Rubricoccus marinus TaxID=716817 RepID=A0A259TXH2_9BACT|nr:imidazoleglycerol-phosphate dehydratase HisB [Rubricoccus marinus]OZC02317.1 imidazoleglycerol-phosphate dehydratase [Rubricoccus marinus]
MFETTRTTKETTVSVSLRIDGSQEANNDTGLPFLDHMLDQLAFHAGWDLTVKATGDLHVDEHHTVEDVAITLGGVLQEAWRDRSDRFARYGQRWLPMDDALVLAAVDLSGRPFCDVSLKLKRDAVGGIAAEMWDHFFESLATSGAITLHIKRERGRNSHHVVEASFKALARALREALAITDQATSTKGSL